MVISELTALSNQLLLSITTYILIHYSSSDFARFVPVAVLSLILVLNVHVPLSAYHAPLAASVPSFLTTLNNPLFFCSCAHLSTHAFIFCLLFALPIFTVGMTFSILNADTNIVNSLKLECSEYGIPKHAARDVLPR